MFNLRELKAGFGIIFMSIGILLAGAVSMYVGIVFMLSAAVFSEAVSMYVLANHCTDYAIAKDMRYIESYELLD
jgi:hypothetical protein